MSDKNVHVRPAWLAWMVLAAVCLAGSRTADGASFGDDRKFLEAHQKLVVLQSADHQAQVVVIPAYQGRVMTSTASGDAGVSYGWINRALIASGELRPHINVFGGEDRFWVGPEGGPFSLFFSPAAPAQTLEHWQTPAVVDSQPWQIDGATTDAVTLSARAVLKNRHGTDLAVGFTRTVRLLNRPEVQQVLGVALPAGVSLVAYESDNRIRNEGAQAWTKATGLPSVWILGMFTPGAKTTVVIPLRGPPAKPVVHSDYFGAIPPDRLRVADGVVFFRGDGQARGKLGIPPAAVTAFAGSWDPVDAVLTIVNFDLPADAARQPYVDSRWLDMPDPYAGDVLNSYNDGAPAPGVPPLGPFYEVESSSPAAELAAGATLRHRHRTMHFQGPRETLDAMARTILHVSLDTVEKVFSKE